MTGPTSAHRGRRDNGLSSDEFSPVADVDPRLADHLLDVLGLRDVAAYVEPAPVSIPVTADRLYVAADQTGAAREVLTEIASELGIEVSRGGHSDGPGETEDPLSRRDTDAEFAAIVAGLEDLGRPLFDPVTSVAAHAVSADEAPLDEVEHFRPPLPPPLPRPALPTAMAAIITLVGIAVIAFGTRMGLPPDLPFPLGVVLVLFGAGMLILRLRPEPRDDSDDDGAVV
jgi:hypothetical protein